jgi:hypothetical protein
MAVQLQQRDFQVLKHVFRFRVATYSQLRTRFFRDNFKTTFYDRIRRLCREGYLRPSSYTVDANYHKYLELSEKAWPQIESKWPFEIERPHFKSESPEHDIRFAEVMSKLEGLKVFHSSVTENLLQSSMSLTAEPHFSELANLQADGALLLKNPDGRPYVYGLEFELSKKAPERYHEKLMAYYHASAIDGVIYICSEQQIANSLVKIDRELRKDKDSSLYFALESDVLNSTGKIFFTNAKADGIELY